MKYLWFALAAFAGHATADYVRCGTAELSQEHKQMLDTAATNQTFKLSSNQAPRTINTFVHVVVSTPGEKAKYPQSMVNKQMSVLNRGFKSVRTSFRLASTDYTVNPAWASAFAGTQAEIGMKKKLNKGGYADLNLYFLSNYTEALGVCYFPLENPSPEERILDGCLCLASTMPGSTATDFDLGQTAVHEVGHWFGLYHVFEGNACSGPGDRVSDTPLQKNATSGCPSVQDSCPHSSGVDSIHNFMDYSYDRCLYEFTKGQAARANNMYETLRRGK